MKTATGSVFPYWLSITTISTTLLACTLFSIIVGCNNTPNSKATSGSNSPKSITLLNVSYDPTREFYQEFNNEFAELWKSKTGDIVTIEQSHGGSGKQARAVIDGLEGDVVTLALGYDIDAIAKKSKQLPADWQSRLPNSSSPYTSTIIFVVRKGNPKGIKDWDDLVKGDVSIIASNPKTGGGARWNYLAAWGFALNRELGDLSLIKNGDSATPEASEKVKAAHEAAKQFITEIYKRIPVLDSAARGSTNTFIQRGIGDVLISWENEAFLSTKDAGSSEYEIVVPSISILAAPPVAIVDKVVDKRGTREVAQAYLEHLYTPIGQKLAAKHFFRPSNPEGVDAKDLERFVKTKLFTIEDVFGGWARAQSTHFDDGGVFDQIYQPSSK